MQEFTRADELYQAGMKVDPQNANLLVHRGIVKLQSVGESIQGGSGGHMSYLVQFVGKLRL